VSAVVDNVINSSTGPTGPSGAQRPGTLRHRQALLHRLTEIDRDGWDSAAATALLLEIRAGIVRPNVRATGLQGLAADQAEATAWEATWEALCSPYLRRAESPWGVLTATARRAALGELVAGVYLTSARTAWHLVQMDADAVGGSPATPEAPHRRALPRVFLTDGGDHVSDTTDVPHAFPLGPLLAAVVQALVGVGWDVTQARHLVVAIAAGAERGVRTGASLPGWRRVSRHLGIPPWQVRRVTMLLLGAPDWPGLVERLVADGTGALEAPGLRAALRATVCYSLRSPATAFRQALTRGLPDGSQAA